MSTDGKHTELNQYFQQSKLLFYKKEIKTVASPIRQKTGFHARSNSLPSRPHPIISEFDENICRVRDSQAISKSSSSSSIGHKLSSLQDLYDSVNSSRGYFHIQLQASHSTSCRTQYNPPPVASTPYHIQAHHW